MKNILKNTLTVIISFMFVIIIPIVSYAEGEQVNFTVSNVEYNGTNINVTLNVSADDTVWAAIPSLTLDGQVLKSENADLGDSAWYFKFAEKAQTFTRELEFVTGELSEGDHVVSVTKGEYFDEDEGVNNILWFSKKGGILFEDDSLVKVNPFTFKVGKSSEQSSPSYSVSLGTPSVSTIEPTSEQPFTVPVVMTSESALSGAELDLSCNPEVAKITGITLAEGLTANGNQTIAADGSSAQISFFGNEQSAKEGLTVATVSMQPVAEGISSLSVTEGTAAMSGTTLEYPVTVPESPVTVEVKSRDVISASTYVSTPEGMVTLVKYTPGTAPAEGKVPAYDGTAMYQGPDHTWLCLVKGDPDKAKIGMIDGTAASVAHPQKGETSGSPADLNANDRVNIVDAQIAYDLATGKYTEIAPALTDTSIDLLHWLMADVNGDETVTAQDARAIQAFIHAQEWFKDAA